MRIIATLHLFLLVCLNAAAQPVVFPIRGASHFSESYIRGLFASAQFDSARVSLQTAYANDGYLVATLSGDSILGLLIDEGPLYTIASVTIEPPSTDSLLRRLNVQVDDLAGRTFSTSEIEGEMLRLIGVLSDAGYPLASGRAVIDTDDSLHTVTLRILLDRRERVTISRVEIAGNTSTRESLIRTAAAIPPNAPFSDELANDVRGRLVRLKLFSEVAEPQLFKLDSGGYGLLLSVVEGSSNTFDGVIGFQPEDSAQGGGVTVTGLVNLLFRNIFGSGRRLGLRWQKQSATNSQLELRYGEPFLLNLPLDLEVSFRQNQQEATPLLLSYVQRFVSGDFYYGLSDAFSLRLGGAIEWTIPQSDTAQPCFLQLLNTRTFETTVGIGYDTRSNPFNPISGVRYSTSYTLGSKSIRGPAPCDSGLVQDDTRQRGELDLEGYLPLGSRVVLAGGLHYGEVRASLLQEGDLYRFGGEGTVRGYRENLIRASRRTWGTFETRLLLSSSSYAAIFFDGGYYLRPADPLRPEVVQFEEWIYGYGIGAQIETPVGLIRVSYALGKGDTFATGKIFVGLVNQF